MKPISGKLYRLISPKWAFWRNTPEWKKKHRKKFDAAFEELIEIFEDEEGTIFLCIGYDTNDDRGPYASFLTPRGTVVWERIGELEHNDIFVEAKYYYETRSRQVV